MTSILTQSEAVGLVHKLLRGNQIFSVTNIKADGTSRNFVVNPKAYRNQIKGTGPAIDPASNPLHVKVPDMRAGSWRTLNLATALKVVAAGQTYYVR